MRVIAGRFRSRPLKSVPGLQVRPTPDRLREALFNVLAPRISGTTFLDAYAGSGSVGIEALSRGAAHVILIERNPQALLVARDNLRSLKIESEVTLVRGKATVLIPNYKPDIAFIDPPYDQEKEYTESLTTLAQLACGLVIAQHPSKLMLEPHYGTPEVGVIEKYRVLKQGDNSLSFYLAAASDSAGE